MAMEPATARPTLTGRFALKDLCVKSRWKPTVMPCPVMAYMAMAIPTSCQPSQPPQATGTAAATAKNGTMMKIASVTCSVRLCLSSPSVPNEDSNSVSGALVSVASDIWFPSEVSTSFPYGTVTYGSVTLNLNGPGTARCLPRNRLWHTGLGVPPTKHARDPLWGNWQPASL